MSYTTVFTYVLLIKWESCKVVLNDLMTVFITGEVLLYKWLEVKKKISQMNFFVFLNKSNFLILCSEKLKCFSDDFSFSSVRLAPIKIQEFSWKFNEKENSYWK